MRTIRAFIRSPSGVTATVCLAIVAFLAIAGPPLFTDEANQLHVAAARQGVSSTHWLGTDELGRDLLARTITATRLSVLLALGAVGLAFLIGVPLGASAALLGPRGRRFATQAVSTSVAFPAVIIALFVTAVMGPGASAAVVGIGLALTPFLARIALSLALEVSSSDYLAAARVAGLPKRRLLGRYLLANISEPLILQASLALSGALVTISALSFLGLGVQPPDYDWGLMLSDGLQRIYVTPSAALAPAAAIVLTGVCFSFFGEALARSCNPTLWTQPRRRRRRPDAGEQPSPALLTRQPPELPVDELLLHARNVTITFPTDANRNATPVCGVSVDLLPGELIGLVGESGSGKSLTALGIAQLLPPTATLTADALVFSDMDTLRTPRANVRELLARRLAVVFQDPGTSLNPALRIGTQMTEGIRRHRGLDRHAARALAVDRLAEVQVTAPERRLGQYPHELSGGMQQRVMIATGLMAEPTLILADEPTTALDVTIQAQIIDVLREVNRAHGTAILLISHDIGLVTDVCDRILVMYGGRIVEDLTTEMLAQAPAHPYTRALIAAVPRLDTDVDCPLDTIPGRPPLADANLAGCAFAPRCPLADPRCHSAVPALLELAPRHRAACWYANGDTPTGDAESSGGQ